MVLAATGQVLLLVLRVAPAAIRGRARPVSSPAALVPSIPLVPDSQAQVLAVPAAQVRVPASEPAQVVAVSALRVRVALALDREALRLPEKLRVRNVLQVRRVAAAVSSIPRPKKAR